MKLSELRQQLRDHGLRLSRSLGQNFLHDGNQLRRILAAAQPGSGDQILEVGPGLGPLTEGLLASGAEVLAVETDARLVALLRERFASSPRLALVHADALEWIRQQPRDWTRWKLVANLPYSVGSAILAELAMSGMGPGQMVVTLQREVLHRLVAGPPSKDYGVLTLLVQLDYEARDWFHIPPSCFFPAPKVDSACVTLQHRPAPLLGAVERMAFVRIVKRGFSQRRKQLRKLLRSDWPEAELAGAWEQWGLASGVRAESISLAQYVGLARRLSASSVSSSATAPSSGEETGVGGAGERGPSA